MIAGPVQSSKEEKMAEIKFTYDFNRLPEFFAVGDFSDKYSEAVQKGLENILQAPPNAVTLGAIVGLLLSDEHFEFNANGFDKDIQRAWSEFIDTTRDVTDQVQSRKVYEKIAEIVKAGKIRTGDPDVHVFFQEFATVGRFAIKGVAQIPPNHQNFETQVRLGFDSYVAGKPPLESLALPPLTDPDGGDVEIDPENIKAVALIYAGWNLEEMRLFHVVDRITEIFLNGALPIGFDAGGKALDQYYWDREDRMNEAERRMQYSRVLGAPGGDVSKEVQPNTKFESLFMRFLSSLAELDRQQRLEDRFESGRRPLNLTGEYVRKAGRDLAANCSFYGWANSHFAARRLNDHINVALNVLKQPSIQKVYGVTNPYQVIERVASTEFGVSPNIVRYRTMADAGNTILNLVARYHKVWTRSNGLPLFEERNGSEGIIPGDIKLTDRDNLMNQTQFWLAVNGIKDEEVNKLSQPEVSAYAPSIPNFGSMLPGSSPAGNNGHGADTAMDKLKQMVAQGQVPTLDQLQQLIPGAKMGT
jgi:hypothetical protein